MQAKREKRKRNAILFSRRGHGATSESAQGRDEAGAATDSLRISLVYSFAAEIAPEHVISESKVNRARAINGGK